jgi:hypothetical protein
MPFEVYRPRASKKEGPKPVVRLSKSSLVLNKVAREKLNMPEYLELAYEKKTRTIRIKPADKSSGIALKKTKVFAKGFFNNFKIKSTGTYDAQYEPEKNEIYVKLA